MGDIRRVKIMNRKVLKGISALLAVSVVLPLAACGKKKSYGKEKRSGQKITADTPWFNNESIEIGVNIDESRGLEDFSQILVGIDEKRIIVRSNGYYTSNGTDGADDLNPYKNSLDQLTVIDRDSKKTIQIIDISNTLKTNLDIDDGATYSGGKIFYRYYTHMEDTSMEDPDNYTYTEMVYDADTGVLEDTHEYDQYEPVFTGTYMIYDYRIDTESFYDDNTNRGGYYLHVTFPEGNKEIVKFSESDVSIDYISFIAAKNKSTAVIMASTDSEWRFYELDLKTLKVKTADQKEYEWFDQSKCDAPFTGSDGNVYFFSTIGILKPDFQSRKIEVFFNYSSCNVNRNTLSSLSPVDINENKIIFAGRYNSKHVYGQPKDTQEFAILELTKTDKNPNAGKTILELYTANDRSEDLIGDAIVKFNDTNSDYFIEVTERYEPVEFLDYSASDDFYINQLNGSANLSNQLAIDIMNGDGPDILMNAASLSQLYSDNYLADLTPFAGFLDSSKYFTNIFEAAKKDGKLYNIPVCYTVNGIQTKTKDAGASGIGFTTSEYEKFIKETLNGTDVIRYGQPYYFAMLFNASRDMFVKNGKADFSGPEFAALAEYVKNNVYDKTINMQDPSDIVYKGEYIPEKFAMHQYCKGMEEYLSTMIEYGNADTILGIPSTDGRGPLIGPYITVAVSAHAQNIDACGDFVKILMNDEIQSELAMSDCFVANRKAFRTGAEAAIEYFNGIGFRAHFGDYGLSQENFVLTDKEINKMEKIIESCSGIDSIDPQITIILIEEMPAYFSGQKDLSSVTKIAQDRAQKVLNERK